MTPSTGGGPLEGVRILELTQRYPPALGGVERHVERLVRELRGAGATVNVVTSDLVRDEPFTRGAFATDREAPQVRRHRALRTVNIPHGLGILVPGMASDALRARADVVHAHAFGHFPLWSGRLARAFRGIPLVVTPHSDPGTAPPLAQLWSRTVAQLTVRGADRTVALSRAEATWLESLGVRPERIRVIHGAIDLAEFAPRPHHPVTSNDVRVLFVGRLDPAQKGLEPLIRAMGLVPRELRPVLRIVGEDWGGLNPTLALARQLGVGDRVVVLGAVSREKLLQEYYSADVFVLSSLFDSFPVVVMEAMAAGLPVVATRVGGVPEMVDDGRTGLLVPPGNPGALAAGIRTLLEDRNLRTRFGEEGRRRVARFEWARVTPDLIGLFAEVAGRRSSPSAL
jgi:glycosyltransferase involved in cell wall biosynthesis